MIELQKNSMEKRRFQLSEFRGQKLVNIRVWVRNDDDEPIATRKGITFKVDMWPEFLRALRKLEEEMLEAGVIKREEPEFSETQ